MGVTTRTELLFARLDHRGKRIDDIKLITDAYRSDRPSLVWNGSGYGLAWRHSVLSEVLFVRLDVLGNPVSSINAVAEALIPEQVVTGPLLVWTGADYGIGWGEFSSLRLTRLDSAGEPLGVTELDNAPRVLESLVWNGFQYSAFWRRMSKYYFLAVDENGNPLGVERLVASGPDHPFTIAARDRRGAHVWDGEGYGAVMSMCLSSDGECELVFGLLDAAGNALSIEPIATGTENPALDWTGAEYGIAWQVEDGTGTWFARVGPRGRKILGEDFQVTLGTNWQQGPRLVWNGVEHGLTIEPAGGTATDSIWFARIACVCGDGDGDGFTTCADDCDDGDPAVFPGAAEVNDGRDNQCPDDPGYGLVDELSVSSGFTNPADKDEYSWPPQPGATLYEVARSTTPEFADGCLADSTPVPVWIDPEKPDPGTGFYYLNRAAAPFAGSWGRNSAGVERVVACP